MAFRRRSPCAVVLLLSLAGRMADYFPLHPLDPVPGICRGSGFFDRGRMRVDWPARFGEGREPLPAVLVHPDRRSLSADMEGICLALAREGFFAAAARYRRLENLEEENPRSPGDRRTRRSRSWTMGSETPGGIHPGSRS